MSFHRSLLFLAMATFASAASADGELDPTFAAVGARDIIFAPTANSLALSSVLQPDAKFVVAGAASNSEGDLDFAVTRLMPDGALDAQFAPYDYYGGGRSLIHFPLYPTLRTHNAYAFAAALQSGGKIVLAGTADGSPYAEGGGPTSLAMVRLLADGTPDEAFGNAGNSQRIIDGASGRALVVLADGSLAVAGSAGGLPHLFVFDKDGVDPATSASDLVSATASAGYATALAIDAFGRIVVTGFYNDPSELSVTYGDDCFVARYGPGAQGKYVLDTAFGNGGRFVFGFDVGGTGDDYCNGVAILHGGEMLVVGEASYGDGNSLIGVAWLTADGQGLDPAFANGGQLLTYFEDSALANAPRAVKVLSDGKIVIAGSGGVADPSRAPSDFGILRLNRDGTYDDRFFASTPGSNEATVMLGFEWYFYLDTGGVGESDGAFALSIDNADRICVSGIAQHGSDGFDLMAVARLDSGKIFVGDFDRLPR